jgi:hypothetical protein
MFLDFLAGNQTYQCTPWSNPNYNVFGWQRPCYLLTDEGYAPSYRSLMEETEWERYGVGRNRKCDNCMAHCGFEGTAVDDTFAHPLKALKVLLRGPQVEGPMAPELPFLYDDQSPRAAGASGDRPPAVAMISPDAIKRASRQEESRRAGA